MRALITAMAAAGLMVFSLQSFSADEVKTAPNMDKPGRAIEEGAGAGTVKAPGKAKKDSRAIDAEKTAVKSKGASDQPGRTVEKDKK